MADQIFQAECGFFDAVNRDRLYTADQMNRPYKRFVSNGVFAARNGSPSEDFEVIPHSGMQIRVKAGEGMFDNKWFAMANDTYITVPTNTGSNSRNDSIIIQVDNRLTGRVGNVVYRTGGQTVPEINTNPDIKEYRLANIFVAVNANEIVAGNITDLRGTDGCPWVTSLVYQPDNSYRIDEFLRTYGVNNATRIEETVLFTSNSPVINSGSPSPGVVVSADITSFDYVDIRYAAFGRTGIVRFKGSDIRTYDASSETGSHWSEFNRTSARDPEDDSTPLEKVDFLLEKIDATHIWWQSQGWAWDGKAASVGKAVELSQTNNLGIFSVTGINYVNAGSTKDPELTDIRVGYDGTIYDTAGDAVRAQAMRVDATLTQSREAADSKTVGGIVNSDSAGVFRNGYFLSSVGSVVDINNPSSGAGWSYCIIPCKTGDHIIVSAGAGSNPCQYAWLDSAYECISRSNQVPTDLTENNIVVAPLNANYILVNSSTTFLDASKRKLYNLCMHGSDIFEAKQGIENEIIFSDNENLRTIYRRKGSSVLLPNGVTVSTDLTGVISISGTATATDMCTIIEKYNPTVIIPNTKYEIEVIGLTGRTSTALQLSVRQTGESSASVLLTAWGDGKYVITTPATVEYFRMFFTLLNGGTGDVSVTVNVRPVGADGIYRTSIFGNSLIRAVKEAKKKYGSTVIIDSGTIDIVEDFISCYGESFFTSYNHSVENGWGIVITNGMTLRGLSDSLLTCDPGQYQSSDNNISDYFSPLMLAGDCTLENLKIISENTKYCVHDDWMDKTVKARHVYKNCIMIKNDNLNRCLGGGLTNSCEIIIKDCYFKDNTPYPVSYHNCINANALSRIVIDGCYFDNGGIRLANYGESAEITIAYIHGNSYKTAPQVVFESASYQTVNMAFVAYNNEIRN